MNDFSLLPVKSLLPKICLPLKVTKHAKTTTTRTVMPSVSDTLSLDGGGSVTGMGGYAAPMVYRPGPAPAVPMDYPTHTVPRNYHYGPPVGYEDYRSGPPSETYASLSRAARMDDRYRYPLGRVAPPASDSSITAGLTSLCDSCKSRRCPDRPIQMVTELWTQTTEPTAEPSWTPMLLSRRYPPLLLWFGFVGI